MHTHRHTRGARFTMLPRLALGAGVLAMAMAGTLHAQALVGMVRDDKGSPVPDVVVTVHGSNASARTDSSGMFRLTALPQGLTYVTAQGGGVLPTAELVKVTPRDTLEFVLARADDDAEGQNKRQQAEERFRKDVATYERVTDGAKTARVITAQDIAHQSPAVTTDLLRGVVGFRIVGFGTTARVISSAGRCPPAIFVDGTEQLVYRLNDIRPQLIKALLAYDGYAVIPPELRSIRTRTSCGTIAIYTR